MRSWQVQEAKARFSELLRESEQGGPQAITSHGREVAVVLSKAEYERLSGSGQSLVDFIRNSPLFDSEDIDLTREQTPTRDVEL